MPAAVAIGPVLDDSNSSAGNGGSYFASVELAVDADKPRYGSSFATGCCIGCTSVAVTPLVADGCIAGSAGCSATPVEYCFAGHCNDAADRPAAADAAVLSAVGLSGPDAADRYASGPVAAASAMPAAVGFAADGAGHTGAVGSAAADSAVVSEPAAALHAAAGSVPAEPVAAGPIAAAVPVAAGERPAAVEPAVAAAADATLAVAQPAVLQRRAVPVVELLHPHFAALSVGRYSEWFAAAPAFFYRLAGLFVARSH